MTEEKKINQYEILFILSPDLDENGIKTETEGLVRVINRAGGTVTQVEPWGVRKLAYEIKKRTQGFYVLMLFESLPTAPAMLVEYIHTRQVIIRHLTTVITRARQLEEKRKQTQRAIKAEKDKQRDESSARAAAKRRAAEEAEAKAEQALLAEAEPDQAEPFVETDDFEDTEPILDKPDVDELESDPSMETNSDDQTEALS